MRPDHAPSGVHVVAAAVTDVHGRVLIAQRPPGKALAGSWEFPGGKLEPGETRVAGLARELREELGIDILGQPRPLIRLRHGYPFGEVLMDMWVVNRYAGEPAGLDGQQLRWCRQDELAVADLLPADRPIVAALRLPERLNHVSSADYCIGELGSPSLEERSRLDGKLSGVFCSSADEAVAAAGADDRSGRAVNFLVMRCVLPDVELAVLCSRVLVPVYARGASLDEVWALGASGINGVSE